MHDRSSFRKGPPELTDALALEMQEIVRDAAGSVRAGETVKAQMRRAWERLRRPSWWRLRAAWYGEAGCWSGKAIEDLRRRAAALGEKEAKARDEASELGGLYAAIAARLHETDPDFHSHDIAALEQAARRLGAVDRAVAKAKDTD